MSEGTRGRGRKGGQPEGGPAGSSPEPGRGRSAFPPGWIVSANVLAVVALVLAVVALVFHFTEEDEEDGAAVVAQPTATAQPTAAVQATPTPPVVVENVSVDDDPSWGPEDAPVTIVEFSEFL